jgi:fructose-1,6-bisphosphatase II
MPKRGQTAAGPHSTDGLALLERSALAASRAAALACQLWVGRGNPEAADAAATDAMRAVLGEAAGRGTVVVGEGTKDDAPMLYVGERLGQGSREFDIAVDPLECTTLCAKGIPGSLATIAIAEPGAMAALGPSFYMDKLVAPVPHAAPSTSTGAPRTTSPLWRRRWARPSPTCAWWCLTNPATKG